MTTDWDIKPRGEGCGTCEGPFEDRQPYFTALMYNEQGYVRVDFCEDCWTAKKAETSAYSSWQGVFRVPAPPPEEPLKKENAESMLRRLMEDEDPSNQNVIYILAVMLERKRLLVERDVQRHDDGAMVRIYEHRKTGETFLVPDPRLNLGELESVQEEVVAMLGGPREQAEEDPGSEGDAGPAEEPASDVAAREQGPSPAGFKDGFYSNAPTE